MRARTLAGELRRRALDDPSADHEVVIRSTDAGDLEGPIAWTSAALWREAERVGRALRRRGIGPGDRLLLLSPEVRDGVAAHFGAWAVGASPIHVGLPYRLGDIAAYVAQLRATADRVGASRLLISPTIAAFAGDDPRVLPIAELRGEDEGAPLGDPDALPAPDLIQLTSGSTGAPRAVVIPHARVIDHLRAIAAALPAGERASGVSWLPLYHDMGLIGGLLYPFFTRFPVHLIAAPVFQSRPYGWLEALADEGATHTAGPPSAYALMLRLAARARDDRLRLDRLRCAMIGAEPIPPALLRSFVAAFAPLGLDARAFFPVYGLAEATVAVTFPAPLGALQVARVDRRALTGARRAIEVAAADEADAIELCGVGRPLPGTELRIVDEGGVALAEDRVGEIQVRAATLMREYLGEPEASAAALAGGWLRTGDLGFLRDGALFVAGREKDVILKGGQSLLPGPIEAVAAAVPGVRPGCVVAVGVADEARCTERVVVVAETRRAASEHAALAGALRDALRLAGVAIDQVVLVAPGWLPRTTSGKHRRREVAERLAAR
ncbi:MAG: AMP-binding protein [Nannocystaceae bacterium]